MGISKPEIIIAGSAVSFLDEVAPGIGQFVDELLRGLASVTKNCNSSQKGARWFSALTRAVVENRGILVRTRPQLVKRLRESYKRLLKFEEVLRLAELCGVEPQNLVTAAYNTTSFNLNHAALGYLATTGRYEVLTTNFDNGIELAGNLEVELGYPKNRSESNSQSPVVVKLHGCSLRGSIIATTSKLLTAKSARRYEFLEELCKGRVVRLFGYSGRGDVDIAPHLSAAAAKSRMLWFNHKVDKPPFEHAEFQYGDLLKLNPIENPLLQLAVNEGWTAPKISHGDSWQPETLRKMIETIPGDQAARLLAQIWGIVDSQFHLIYYLLDFKLCEDINARKAFVSWYVESNLDLPPSRTGDNAEVLCMAQTAREFDASFASRWEAFGHWRMGRWASAQQAVSLILDGDMGKPQDRLHAASLGLAIVTETLWCSPPQALNSVLSENEGFIYLCEGEISKLVEEEDLDIEVQIVARRNVLHLAIWRAAMETPKDGPKISRHHELLGSLTEQAADLQLWEAHRYSELFYRALQAKFRIHTSTILRPANGPRHLRSVQFKKLCAYLFPIQTIGWLACKIFERKSLPLLQIFPAMARPILVRRIVAELRFIQSTSSDG